MLRYVENLLVVVASNGPHPLSDALARIGSSVQIRNLLPASEQADLMARADLTLIPAGPAKLLPAAIGESLMAGTPVVAPRFTPPRPG